RETRPRERGKTKTERIRLYLEDTAGGDGGAGGGYDYQEEISKVERRSGSRGSDAKSIGSLSQHFFESEDDDDDNQDRRYYGTCNGYYSQPGSKSNLLLCTECDLKTRTCSYRPQSSVCTRFVEERLDVRRASYSTSVQELGDCVSPCLQCNSAGLIQCVHCNFSDTNDGDLICFRCQSAEASAAGEICDRCESTGCKTILTEDNKWPVDALVKIQVNNRSIDVDSDEQLECESSSLSAEVERLATIDEAKGDSENGDENTKKINGTPRTRYLNYMIVLLL
ncbi:uncharacterized protein LOC107268344, partial [Cephus cinctus]|uniref:Uncharacterized protein LOC107268344 n=1 Tax=Cephus cinctus TaxID=211228 RepID=A0AAJ7BX07_CEPCN